MDDFFAGLDFSNLDEQGKEFVDLIKEGGSHSLSVIKSQSKPIAESAERTISIGNTAIVQLVAGKLDMEGAKQIFRRGVEQLEDLARAEGNLIVSNSVSFLKKLGETAIGFVPKLFGM